MIVHCKRSKYDIYIGRKSYNLPESKWKNPYIIGIDGTRDFCILQYELYLNTRPDLLRDLKELKNKILGCWCAPLRCHGNILLEQAESFRIKNWFSNMTLMDEPLLYQDVVYKTSENFYQAMKLPKDRIDLRKEIASMSPYKAKTSIKKYEWRDTWNKEESLKVMEYILRFKFNQQSHWWRLLSRTNNWEITEWNNWNDTFWGKDIKTEIGENHLGKILMKIRDDKNH